MSMAIVRTRLHQNGFRQICQKPQRLLIKFPDLTPIKSQRCFAHSDADKFIIKTVAERSLRPHFVLPASFVFPSRKEIMAFLEEVFSQDEDDLIELFDILRDKGTREIVFHGIAHGLSNTKWEGYDSVFKVVQSVCDQELYIEEKKVIVTYISGIIERMTIPPVFKKTGDGLVILRNHRY